METMDYEACYAALQLTFGAGLKEVNQRWRRLSREHHPDRHMRDPKAYRLALEKQKQLNNARDFLKHWFETNPNSPPPRKKRGSAESNSQGNSSGSKSTQGGQTGNQSQSQSTSKQGQQNSNHSSQGRSHTHSHQYHWDHRTHSNSGASSSQHESAPGSTTGWFTTTDLNLTPLQQLVKKIDAYCNRPNSDGAAGLGMALVFAAVFGPLWILTATLGFFFPDLPGHYPDWLGPLVLFGSGYATTYLFRWYFAETAIIKLQEQAQYFRTDRTVKNSMEFLKLVIEKQTRPNAQWKFVSSSDSQEAILEFEEEILPEIKRSRRLVIRFQSKQAAAGAIVGLEVRATSPLNSFSCRKIAESVVLELKKNFHDLAA